MQQGSSMKGITDDMMRVGCGIFVNKVEGKLQLAMHQIERFTVTKKKCFILIFYSHIYYSRMNVNGNAQPIGL
jgi:hypothetical protein